VPALAGILLAVGGAWVCDDAFISFRYIDQFEQGHGLVYNPGERVEGYTHFLWVMLLAAVHRLSAGADLVAIGRYLSIPFYAALVAVVFVRAMRSDNRVGALPLAAWCLALHGDLRIFASSGLETAPFVLFVTLGCLAAAADSWRPDRTAGWFAIATLFRPEGILWTGVALVYLRWRGAGFRQLGGAVRTYALLVAPLFVWRRIYYGDWLPNTFYAKSVSLAYWSQGWHYVRLYFEAYPVLLATLVAAIVVLVRDRRVGRRRALVEVGILQTLATLLYVLRLGGDFMFARFLLPVTPLLYVVLEEMLRGVSRSRSVPIAIAAAGITCAGPVLRDRVLPTTKPVHGIVNERACYPDSVMAERRRAATQLGITVAGIDARWAIPGGQASLAYYAHLPYVAERNGLTDREVGHRPLDHRGRPGHEKLVAEPDLRARRVDFLFRVHGDSLPGAINQIWFGNDVAVALQYDNKLMDALQSRPGVRFIHMPAHIDRFLDQDIARATPQQRVEAWKLFWDYYFKHNDDPERLQRARDVFAAAGVATTIGP